MRNTLVRSLLVLAVVGLVGFGFSKFASPASANNYPVPEWWNSTDSTSCDPAHYQGYAIGVPWEGLQSCGPNNSYNVVNFTRGGVTIGSAAQWQCVELVMRYMMLAWGATPYGANGSQIVSNWNSSVAGIKTITASNNIGQNGNDVPSIGDVLSFGNGQGDAGHTAIITDVRALSGAGNDNFTIFQQNVGGLPVLDSSDIWMRNYQIVVKSGIGLDTNIMGWLHQQNGNMQAYMAGINPPSGDKQVFTIDRSGQIVTSWQCSGGNCPGGWANWQEVNAGTTRFSPNTHLGAVMDQSNLIEVFGTDVNGVVWHMWGQQGSWSGLASFDGTSSGDVTAGNWDNNHDIVLWITGTDHSPYYRYSQNGAWTSWTKYANATFPLGTRYIFGRDPGTIDVFALDSDGKIYSNYTSWGQMSWQSSFAVYGDLYNGMGFISEPATVIRDSSNDEEVIATRTDGTTWHDYEQGGWWQGWSQINNSPQVKNEIAATQTIGQIPEIYARDVNYWSWHSWNTGCGNCYSGWTQFSSGIPFATDPDAISNSSYYPEVFQTATDGKTYHQWLSGSNGNYSWSGWQIVSNGLTG